MNATMTESPYLAALSRSTVTIGDGREQGTRYLATGRLDGAIIAWHYSDSEQDAIETCKVRILNYCESHFVR